MAARTAVVGRCCCSLVLLLLLVEPLAAEKPTKRLTNRQSNGERLRNVGSNFYASSLETSVTSSARKHMANIVEIFLVPRGVEAGGEHLLNLSKRSSAARKWNRVSIVRSFVHSFVPSFVPQVARSLVRSFVRSIVRSLDRSLARSYIHSRCLPACLLVRPELELHRRARAAGRD